MSILRNLVQEKAWDTLLKAAQRDQVTLRNFALKEMHQYDHNPVYDVVNFTFSNEDTVNSVYGNNPSMRRLLAQALSQGDIIESPPELVGVQVTYKLNLTNLAKDTSLIEEFTKAGQFPIIKALVEHHQFVDPAVFKIYFTSQNRNKDEDQHTLDLFLKYGLNINEGLIALATESQEKAGEVVKLLLSNNADINYVQVTEFEGRQYKQTPLSAAASNPKNIAMVELLLSSGADVNIPDVSATSRPAQYSNEGYKEITELLRKYTNPFGKALFSKNLDELITLLSEKNEDGSPKYNVNDYNGLHNTPLNVAVESDDILFVRKLFEAGAKWNDESVFLVKHSKLILELLIKKGADINQACHLGYYTPLARAILNGDAEKVSILLACGADPNFSYSTITPLGQLMLNYTQPTYKEKQLIIVPLLLKHGANVDQVFDPNKPNGYSHIDTVTHNTPRKLAGKYAPHMVATLESHYSNPLGGAIVEGRWDDAFAFLAEKVESQNKYDINAAGLTRSPLYFAIKGGGDKVLVQRLLDAGAQIDAATLSLADGDTLSAILADRRNIETCVDLLHGIDNCTAVEAIRKAEAEQDEIDVGGEIWELFHPEPGA